MGRGEAGRGLQDKCTPPAGVEEACLDAALPAGLWVAHRRKGRVERWPRDHGASQRKDIPSLGLLGKSRQASAIKDSVHSTVASAAACKSSVTGESLRPPRSPSIGELSGRIWIASE